MKAFRWLLLVCAVWLGVARSAHAEPEGASADAASLAIAVDSIAMVERMCPGELRRIPITIRNVGTASWNPELRDRFAYHWRDLPGTMVVRDGERTALPGVVAPGQSVQLDARVRAPTEPGRYRFQPALVREQVRWVSTRTVLGSVEVTGEQPALAWSRVGGGAPLEPVAGEPVDVALDVRNDGCAAWSADQQDNMAYHWYDLDGGVVVQEGRRTPLPPLAPGTHREFTAQVIAPPQPGRFLLVWHPLREGMTWLEPDVEPIEVEVLPSAYRWSMHTTEPLAKLAAGDVLAIDVWLLHEGAQPWSSDQGDALSYRWYDESGTMVAEGQRAWLPKLWVPGDDAVISAELVVPSQPGRYTLRWEPVREHVRWFGPSTDGSGVYEVEVVEPRLAWAVDSMHDGAARWVHRTGRLQITIRNTGSEAWVPARGDRFSYRWYERDGVTLISDGTRTSLPGRVEPGESVTLNAKVKGPDQPGSYVLVPELVREHVRWFGPPTEGVARHTIRVERISTYFVVLLFVAGLGLAWLVRRGDASRLRWWAWRLAPALLAGLAIAVVVHCFVDLSGAEPWRKSRWVVFGPAALLGLVLLPMPPKWAAIAAFPVLALITAISLADLAYMHFFGSIVPLTAVLAVHHLADAEATVTSLIEPSYGWLIAVPVLTLLVAITWPRRMPTVAMRRRWPGFVVVMAALLGLLVPMTSTLVRAFSSGLSDKVFSEQNNVARLGIVGAHLFQLLREIGVWIQPRDLSPQQREEVIEQLAEHHAAQALARTRAPGFGAARGFDVVLIQVEALQGWVVGSRVDGQEITPFLNQATDSALYFDQIFDQTAQGRTSDAEYLALSAGHPIALGALAFLHEDNDFYTLGHVLGDLGYQTASAHPYKRGFWNRARLHPRYGFESSKFRRELGAGPAVGWGLADGAFFERIAPDLVEAPEPSFHFYITLSLHHPYDHFPTALRELDLGALDGKPVGNYLQAMRHFDTALAELWATLQREGRAERTLLVIYGDHVTGMGEPPAVLALAGRPTWDPSAHGELHRVPVFAWVGDEPGPRLRGTHSRVGGHIDIGPTVLHLLGVADPRPVALGRPLLDPGPGFAALSDGGAVDAGHLLSARGRGIPDSGACFTRDGQAVPLTECDALRERAAVELRLGRRILRHNLHRDAPTAP